MFQLLKQYLIKSLARTRFIIASTPYQLDAFSTAKSIKSKDDNVWYQKWHGLKTSRGAKPCSPFFIKKDDLFVQRVSSRKSVLYSRLTVHATTVEPQYQAYNGYVALLGVWSLDIVWHSPQSSLRLDLGFSSPQLHASWMQFSTAKSIKRKDDSVW